MSNNFNIDEEIDKLIDKLTIQFKDRLKKLVVRSEKIVLKQYITSQKETGKSTPRGSFSGMTRSSDTNKTSVLDKKDSNQRRSVLKRETEYYSSSDSDVSEE